MFDEHRELGGPALLPGRMGQRLGLFTDMLII